MKKPIIFVLDDDQQVLNAVLRDLKEVYRKNYKVVGTGSVNDALSSLKDLKSKSQKVALFISDQRMPEMEGVEFLEKAKEFFPEAKRVLLTAYSDTDAAIKAINEVGLDYYLMKPWDPPEEKLYPVLDELLDDWQNKYRPDFEGIKILGYQWSPKSHAIKDFFSGNLIPYQWINIESHANAEKVLNEHEISKEELPAVICEDGSILKDPTMAEIGEKTGMNSSAAKKIYDVAIIGAGPAGLAAAVYGGSEGLDTILIEKRAPGGQAGTSARIENYLGFPNGLSGSELSRRAIAQATRFGVEFLNPHEVTDIKLKGNYKILTLSNQEKINARSIIITTGVEYKKLEAEGINNFTGAGVYYGSATTEANACRDKAVYIVGGGNSAGQAAMYLAGFARQVYIVMINKDLASGMSQYLVDQIKQTKNIKVVPDTEVIKTNGDKKLETITLMNNESGVQETVEAGALLIFIGSKPVTGWIKLDIIKNEKGFIVTGNSLSKYKSFKEAWKISREPFLLETCSPGIFAAGDVRAGGISRVASAVGDGAMAIKFVHEYLAEG
jgi:thioredoxin reductase (NADPH)